MQPLSQWKNNNYCIFWVYVRRLRYTACDAHASYGHLCSARLYVTFPHYLIKGTIFYKKLLITKCVFWVSVQLSPETLFIVKRIEWDTILNVYCSSYKVHYSCPILWNLEFYRQILERCPCTKFDENPSSESRVVPCGQTERHEANSRFSESLGKAPKYVKKRKSLCTQFRHTENCKNSSTHS